MRVLMGHYTWVALSRREALSVPAALYRFMETAGPRTLHQWGCAKCELTWMAAILPLITVSTQKTWAPVLYASDSSGAECSGLGGYGVVQRPLEAQAVAQLGRVAEA